MSFAAVAARATRSVLKHMANVDARLDNKVVVGVFGNGYAEASLGALGGIASTDPWFRLATSDALRTAQGSQLIVGKTAYRVTAVKPDGTGLTLLTLEL